MGRHMHHVSTNGNGGLKRIRRDQGTAGVPGRLDQVNVQMQYPGMAQVLSHDGLKGLGHRQGFTPGLPLPVPVVPAADRHIRSGI